MFPWMMPTTAGQLSLYQMALQGGPGQGGGQQNPWSTMYNMWFSPSQGDRSDQNGNQNQPDTGNSMAPPGQAPQGGPDNSPQSNYDPYTVGPRPSYGYQPSDWMRWLSATRGPNQQQQRQAQSMGMLGLSMLQPRPPTHTGPYPWI